jgi:sugar lactone lactonase YvrE
MKTNNTNDFSKRTQSQIASILISNGVAFKPENLGDGRTFYVNDTSIKTRVGIKKAGFILDLSNNMDKGLTFKAY